MMNQALSSPASKSLWDGKWLGDGPLAIFVCGTKPAPGRTSPQLMFGAASNGKAHCALLREQWGRFLCQHAGAALICHNVAETHWLLCDYFRERGKKVAEETLWAFSCTFRLVDVMLLDQEFRRVQGDGYQTNPDGLGRLAERYAATCLPKREQFLSSIGTSLPSRLADFDFRRLEPVIENARAILPIYAALQREAAKIDVRRPAREERSPIPKVAIPPRRQEPASKTNERADLVMATLPEDQRFLPPCSSGPLGTGFDSMAAIALSRASQHGMKVEPGCVETAKAQVAGVAKNAFEFLGVNRQVSKHLGLHPRGPSKDFKKAYDAVASRLSQNIVDRMALPIRLRSKVDTDMLAAVAQWDVMSGFDDVAKAFTALTRAESILRWLGREAPHSAHAAYSIIGKLRSFRPDMAFLRDHEIPTFCPRQGHRFLVAQIPELAERSFAVLCRSWYHRITCRLYWVFATETDPMAKLAADFRSAFRSGALAVELPGQKPSCPSEISWWNSATRFLLRTLPTGFALELAYHSLVDGDQLRALHANDWDYLARVFMRSVAPELRHFLGVDLAYALAANLRTTELEIRQALQWGAWLNPDNRSRFDPQNPDADRQLVRKLKDQRAERIAERIGTSGLEGLAASGIDCNSPAFELFKLIEKSPGGRLTSRWYPFDARRQAWQTLCNDVVKVVAYALVAADYRLVAVDGHELIIEATEEQIASGIGTALTKCCKDAAAGLLRAAAPKPTVTVCDAWPVLSRER